MLNQHVEGLKGDSTKVEHVEELKRKLLEGDEEEVGKLLGVVEGEEERGGIWQRVMMMRKKLVEKNKEFPVEVHRGEKRRKEGKEEGKEVGEAVGCDEDVEDYAGARQSVGNEALVDEDGGESGFVNSSPSSTFSPPPPPQPLPPPQPTDEDVAREALMLKMKALGELILLHCRLNNLEKMRITMLNFFGY